MITKITYVNGIPRAIRKDVMTVQEEYYGKSKDEKPTENVVNASVFYEMDTKKVFMFDEDEQTWIEQ